MSLKSSTKLLGLLLFPIFVSSSAFGQQSSVCESPVIVVAECVMSDAFPEWDSYVVVNLVSSGLDRNTGNLVWENRFIREFKKARTTQGKNPEYNKMLAELTKKCETAAAAFSK